MANLQRERAQAMAKLHAGEVPTGDVQRAGDVDAKIVPVADDEQKKLSAIQTYCAEELH
jgi:hypothetical protein